MRAQELDPHQIVLVPVHHRRIDASADCLQPRRTERRHRHQQARRRATEVVGFGVWDHRHAGAAPRRARGTGRSGRSRWSGVARCPRWTGRTWWSRRAWDPGSAGLPRRAARPRGAGGARTARWLDFRTHGRRIRPDAGEHDALGTVVDLLRREPPAQALDACLTHGAAERALRRDRAIRRRGTGECEADDEGEQQHQKLVPSPIVGTTPCGRTPTERFKGTKPVAKSMMPWPRMARSPKAKLNWSSRCDQPSPSNGSGAMPCGVRTSTSVSCGRKAVSNWLCPMNSTMAARCFGQTTTDAEAPYNAWDRTELVTSTSRLAAASSSARSRFSGSATSMPGLSQ